MASRNNLLKKIRLVYRRSSKLTKSVVLCAIVLSTVTLLTLRGELLKAQAQAEELRSQAAGLEQENQQLQESIDALGSLESVKDIAQNIGGLVDPNTVILRPNS